MRFARPSAGITQRYHLGAAILVGCPRRVGNLGDDVSIKRDTHSLILVGIEVLQIVLRIAEDDIADWLFKHFQEIVAKTLIFRRNSLDVVLVYLIAEFLVPEPDFEILQTQSFASVGGDVQGFGGDRRSDQAVRNSCDI